MKTQHITIIKILAALMLIATAPLSLRAAGITGTPHDLSGNGWGSNEKCIFCHTPHNAKAATNGPLWNHAASSAASFTLYASSTLNALPGQPSATSLACLSCHDGSVAIDSYGSNTGTNMMGGTAKVGTDLSNDHPISFTYDATLAASDGGLVSPTSTSFVNAAHTVPLFSGKMECASCHDVHDNTIPKFLRINNAGSALCLSCHVK
jgi:predicted CXXCH cytochrome family protein